MTTASRLVLGSMQLFVAVTGMIGNLLVILVILRNPRLLRNTYYFLVLHLATCDFLINAFVSSDIYDSFNGRSMISSPVLCKLWWPMHTVFFSAGVLFMVAISIVRNQAVAKPLKPPVSRWKVKVLAVLVYVFATICVLPYVLILQFNHKSECVEEWPAETLNICYTVFLAAVQYFIPVVLLSMVYLKICIVLVKQNREIKLLCASTTLLQQQNLSPYQRFRQHRNVRTFFVSFQLRSHHSSDPNHLYPKYQQRNRVSRVYVLVFRRGEFWCVCSESLYIWNFRQKAVLFSDETRKKNTPCIVLHLNHNDRKH